MPVTVLIFEKVAGKKPVVLLKNGPFKNVLQRLNLDNKNIFYPGILPNPGPGPWA